MKKIRQAKAVYEAIKIPEQLDYIVNKATNNKQNTKEYKMKYVKYVLSTVSCVFLTFVVIVNLSPSFASSISDIPIIGNMAKVFTIEEYKEEDEQKLINAKIPGIENTGNTELEKRQYENRAQRPLHKLSLLLKNQWRQKNLSARVISALLVQPVAK